MAVLRVYFPVGYFVAMLELGGLMKASFEEVLFFLRKFVIFSPLSWLVILDSVRCFLHYLPLSRKISVVAS